MRLLLLGVLVASVFATGDKIKRQAQSNERWEAHQHQLLALAKTLSDAKHLRREERSKMEGLLQSHSADRKSIAALTGNFAVDKQLQSRFTAQKAELTATLKRWRGLARELGLLPSGRAEDL